MGLLTRKKESIEELEDRRDRLVIEEEVTSREAAIAEKKAIVRELKARYGSDWKHILSLGGRLDLQTLRSALVGMKKGLRGMGGATYNPSLSPLPNKNLRR